MAAERCSNGDCANLTDGTARQCERCRTRKREYVRQKRAATWRPFKCAKQTCTREARKGFRLCEQCAAATRDANRERRARAAGRVIPMPELVTCRDCKGVGHRLGAQAKPRDIQMYPCGTCGGRGRLTARRFNQVCRDVEVG